jgi:hypothetical protein
MRIPQTAAPNTPSPQAGAEVWIERRIFGPGIGSPGSEIYYLYVGQDGPDHTAGSDRKERVSGAGCSAGRGGWAALVNSHARNGSSYTVTAYGWACGAATREQAIQAAYEQCRQKSGCDFSKTTLNRTMEIMSAFSSSNRAQQQYLVCDIRSPVEGQRTAPFWTEQASSARSSLCESLEPRGLP